jgi:hypothetical protein
MLPPWDQFVASCFRPMQGGGSFASVPFQAQTLKYFLNFSTCFSKRCHERKASM